MYKTIILAIVLGFAGTGCASQIGAFFNRPVVEDSVKDKLSTISLAADRRTVIVALSSDKNPMYCAEPPPDTATGIRTAGNLALKAKEAEVSVADELETSVTILSARNAPLDAFRTGMFALCQFYMIGAIGKTDVKHLFEKLLTTYVSTQTVPGVVKPVQLQPAVILAPPPDSGIKK